MTEFTVTITTAPDPAHEGFHLAVAKIPRVAFLTALGRTPEMAEGIVLKKLGQALIDAELRARARGEW